MSYALNKTFGGGGDFRLNACVGHNGIQDLQALGWGYDETVKYLLSAALSNSLTIDTCIYPLIFCARHRIELFLKDQLLKFTEIKNYNNDNINYIKKTHNLSNLWNEFSTQGDKIDRRIRPFTTNAEEYINDFAEIDPTGQTFRYPYDKSDNLHLDDISIINLRRFGNRYLEISNLLKDFESLTTYLVDEYALGTHTEHLSRADLRAISNALPLKHDWTIDSFNDVKKRLRHEYNLSNRKLSEAIDIIKNHREFCVNIGLEIPLQTVSPADINTFKSLYLKLNSELEKQGYLSRNPDDATTFQYTDKHTSRSLITIEIEYANQLETILAEQAIITIFTLVELDSLSYFSEEYDLLYKDYSSRAANDQVISSYCEKLFSMMGSMDYLKNGLKKVGQVSLLASCFEQ